MLSMMTTEGQVIQQMQHFTGRSYINYFSPMPHVMCDLIFPMTLCHLTMCPLTCYIWSKHTKEPGFTKSHF